MINLLIRILSFYIILTGKIRKKETLSFVHGRILSYMLLLSRSLEYIIFSRLNKEGLWCRRAFVFVYLQHCLKERKKNNKSRNRSIYKMHTGGLGSGLTLITRFYGWAANWIDKKKKHINWGKIILITCKNTRVAQNMRPEEGIRWLKLLSVLFWALERKWNLKFIVVV